MSDAPKIRKRSRPQAGSVAVIGVDAGVARRGQALVECAIEKSVAEAEASRSGNRIPPPAEAVAAASPREEPKKARGDYEIGCGKPPDQYKFQKGKSGNPKGRPRKEKPRPEDRLEALLAETQDVSIKGKTRRMTMQEIGERHLVQNFAKGDLKTVAFVNQTLDRKRARQAAEAQSADEGLLPAPSMEVLALLSEAKAAELRASPLLPRFDDEQISIILALFGMGADSSGFGEESGTGRGTNPTFEDDDEEEEDGTDDD